MLAAGKFEEKEKSIEWAHHYVWCKNVCTPNESSLSICTLCALDFNVKLWLAKGNRHAICEYLFCKLPVIYATESAHACVEEKTSYVRVAGYSQSTARFVVMLSGHADLPIPNTFSECKDSILPAGTVEIDTFPYNPQAFQPAFFGGQTLFLPLLQVAFVFFPKYVDGLLGFGS